MQDSSDIGVEGIVSSEAAPVDASEVTKTYKPRDRSRRTAVPSSLAKRPVDRLVKAMAYLAAITLIGFAGYYGYSRYETTTAGAPVNRMLATLESKVRQRPRDLGARLALADAYLNLLRYDDALEQYSQAFKLNKKSQPAIVGTGLSYMYKKDDDKALEYFEKEIELYGKGEYARINATLEMAYYQAGLIWFKKNHYDRALDYFKQAAAIKRGSSDTFVMIGRVLVEKRDYNAAMTEFERALNFDPKYADAYYGLGVCLEKLGRKDEALARYRKAREISPDSKVINEAIERLEKK